MRLRTKRAVADTLAGIGCITIAVGILIMSFPPILIVGFWIIGAGSIVGVSSMIVRPD